MFFNVLYLESASFQNESTKFFNSSFTVMLTSSLDLAISEGNGTFWKSDSEFFPKFVLGLIMALALYVFTFLEMSLLILVAPFALLVDRIRTLCSGDDRQFKQIVENYKLVFQGMFSKGFGLPVDHLMELLESGSGLIQLGRDEADSWRLDKIAAAEREVAEATLEAAREAEVNRVAEIARREARESQIIGHIELVIHKLLVIQEGSLVVAENMMSGLTSEIYEQRNGEYQLLVRESQTGLTHFIKTLMIDPLLIAARRDHVESTTIQDLLNHLDQGVIGLRNSIVSMKKEWDNFGENIKAQEAFIQWFKDESEAVEDIRTDLLENRMSTSPSEKVRWLKESIETVNNLLAVLVKKIEVLNGVHQGKLFKIGGGVGSYKDLLEQLNQGLIIAKVELKSFVAAEFKGGRRDIEEAELAVELIRIANTPETNVLNQLSNTMKERMGKFFPIVDDEVDAGRVAEFLDKYDVPEEMSIVFYEVKG